jgi:hypothetical protein
MIPLELPFKGTRTYFHGTDLLPALLHLAAPSASSADVAQAPLPQTISAQTISAQTISVQFHRLATRPVQAKWVDSEELQALRAAEALVALLSLRSPERHLVILEQAQTEQARMPIPRVDWDEAATVRNAQCATDGNWQLAVPHVSLVSLFEHMIALNKQLLNTQFGPHDWLWARVDLPQWRAPNRAGTLEIAFLRQIRGSVFVSEVRFDTVPIAVIYFSRSLQKTAGPILKVAPNDAAL